MTQSNSINWMVVRRLQAMGKSIVSARNAQIEKFNPYGKCDLLPHQVLTHQPTIASFRENITFGDRWNKRGINIPAGNEMLVKQVGRMLAQLDKWEVVGSYLKSDIDSVEYPAVKSTNPANSIKYGKVLRHIVTGQLIAAVVVENVTIAAPVEIAEVYKFDHTNKKWTFHRITLYVRNGTENETGAFLWNVRIKEHTMAYTKYNLLAAVLSGAKIHIVTPTSENNTVLTERPWFKIMVEYYRRELWTKVCGYGWQIEKAYVATWSDVQPELEKLTREGWTEAEIESIL